MPNTVSVQLLVEFSAVFEEEPQSLAHYLTGISRAKLLNVMSFLLGFSNRNSGFDKHYELLTMFFCADNNVFANEINIKLNQLQQKYRAPLKIVNPLTALQLFEFGFDKLNENETQSKAEIEVNLFKAILFQNQANTQAQQLAFDSTAQIPMPARIPLMNLSQSLPFSELINYYIPEVFANQVVKSVFLFEFLSANDHTKALLEQFLAYFAVPDWKTFLKKFIPLMISVIKKDREAHTDIVVGKGPNFESDCNFIDKLIAHDQKELQDYDFRQVRGRPFYKVSEGVYRVIFDLFVIELLHKGLYFKLNEVNKTLPNQNKLKNFRSFYTDEFSERYLLYTLLESIYHKKYIKFTGTEMKATGIDAEPDYYIRNGNKMFLYESKDILINAEIKATYDFKLHEAEFEKKLYYEDKDGKRSNKAVKQLIKNIERALTMNFPFDANYKPERLIIYPILILHDHMYNVPGLNFMVDQWYRDEVSVLKTKGYQTNGLTPLTIVDIDTLVYHQDNLRDNQIKLEQVIDAYHRFVALDPKKKFKNFDDAKQQYQNKTIAFGTFISNYAKDKGTIKPPKMLRQKGILLFN